MIDEAHSNFRERQQSSLHLLRQMCGTVVTCRYSVPPSIANDGSLEALQGIVRDTVARTVLEHPMMHVGLLNEDSARPSWIELDTINLDHHITWNIVNPQDDYESIYRERILYNMDTWFENLETTPGWRLTVMTREQDMHAIDVMLAWNHANFDGISAKIFHETLLKNFNNPDTSQELHYVSASVLQLPSPKDRFPPKADRIVKYPLTAKFTASQIWQDIKPPFVSGKNGPKPDYCPIVYEPFTSTYRTIIIEAPTMNKLLDVCRSHGTTITSLLNALSMVSLALQYESYEKKGKKINYLDSVNALDMRRYMPTKPPSYPHFEPHKTMANIVSIMFHSFPPSLITSVRMKAGTLSGSNLSQTDIIAALENIVWSTAAKNRLEMQERLDLGLKDNMVGIIKFVNDWRSQFRSSAKKPRFGDFTMTNLGVIDGGGEADQWKITRASFQLSTEVTATPFHICPMSVKGGEMLVDVGWQECIMDKAVGDTLTSNLEAWLRYLADAKSENNEAGT